MNLALSDPSCSYCRPRLRSPRVHASVRGQRGAANMMLVQCNSDVPISLACSMWIGTVRTTASSEPRPWGDLEGLLSGRQRLRTQIFRPQVAPSCPTGRRCHRPTSYEGSHRRAGPRQPSRAPATAASDLCCPGSQPCRAASVHHDGRGLTQRPAQVDVAGLGDAA